MIQDPERPLRSDLSPEAVQDLTESIKLVGIIEPLVVTKKGAGYELIAGHRRLVAAGFADLAVVPCMIIEIDGLKKEVVKLHENIARASINAVEWASHLHYLKQQYKLTNASLAKTLGMSESWVEQHLAIKKYPPEIVELVESGHLAHTAARELVQIRDPVKRAVYIKAAVKGGVTTGMAVKWRQDANSDPVKQDPETANPENPDPDPQQNSPETICPVCAVPVPLEESVTLIIHGKCQPQPDPA